MEEIEDKYVLKYGTFTCRKQIADKILGLLGRYVSYEAITWDILKDGRVSISCWLCDEELHEISAACDVVFGDLDEEDISKLFEEVELIEALSDRDGVLEEVLGSSEHGEELDKEGDAGSEEGRLPDADTGRPAGSKPRGTGEELMDILLHENKEWKLRQLTVDGESSTLAGLLLNRYFGKGSFAIYSEFGDDVFCFWADEEELDFVVNSLSSSGITCQKE